MKRRIFSLLLLGVLLLSLIPGAKAAEEDITTFPVEGGLIYFDKTKGAVTRCDHSVTAAEIPAQIDGVPVTSVAPFAFEYCTELREVSFSMGLERIGRTAFAYCSKLTGIRLPDSVTFLDDQVFFDCTELKSLELGKGVQWIGKDAFWGTAYYNSEKNWKQGVLYSGHCLLAAKNTLTGSYKLAENTQVIAGGAFYACTALTSVTLPQGLKTIGDEGFYYCISLEKIEIPGQVTIIGASAFRHCAKLTQVTVGDGIKEIKEQAFAFCGKLKSVTLGKSLEQVGDFAFSECEELTELRFAGNAPALGENSFDLYDYGSGSYVPIPGLTLYYVSGASGWETPLWKGYPTALWSPEAEFADVPEGSWCQEAVDYAVANGLMKGTGTNKFEPESPMTRAMLVTVLWRYEGEPIEGTNIFKDVPDNEWYTKAVVWAAHNGIVGGVGSGRFDPDGKITREQLATILYRYCNSKGMDTSARAELKSFPDGGKVSAYAGDAISWAVAVGLVTGSKVGGNTYLDPQGNATRAQVATILMRFIENVAK